MDEAGKKRRQARRNKRKEAAIKEKKKAIAAGKRNEDSDSEFSYRSVVRPPSFYIKGPMLPLEVFPNKEMCPNSKAKYANPVS